MTGTRLRSLILTHVMPTAIAKGWREVIMVPRHGAPWAAPTNYNPIILTLDSGIDGAREWRAWIYPTRHPWTHKLTLYFRLCLDDDPPRMPPIQTIAGTRNLYSSRLGDRLLTPHDACARRLNQGDE